eukprot:TRINITY_DN422_c0_g1_i2.p1 TRINITY_DN422_c0_g1~~TRINITY_DN422_c0_g1_i2.p1  ORF type:complete len:373 (-),score=34.75 TRINITY_DN422_c0_g1_i2:221-1309(-)
MKQLTDVDNSSTHFIKMVSILILAQVGFASYPVLLRVLAPTVDPTVFCLLRISGTVMLLTPIALVIEGKQPPKKLSHLALFWWLGITGILANSVIYVYGVFWTSPTIASIFQLLSPIMSTILSFILKLERFEFTELTTWGKLFGIFVATGGAALMMFLKEGLFESQNEYQAYGYIALIFQSLLYTIFIICQKKFLFFKNSDGVAVQLYPPLTATVFSNAASLLGGVVVAIVVAVLYPQAYNLDINIFYSLLYAVTVQSVLCYSLVAYASVRVSPTIVMAFIPLQPAIAAIESYFAFGEVPPWYQYMGMGFLTVGLFVLCASKYKEEKMLSLSTATNNNQSDESNDNVESEDIPLIRNKTAPR